MKYSITKVLVCACLCLGIQAAGCGKEKLPTNEGKSIAVEALGEGEEYQAEFLKLSLAPQSNVDLTQCILHEQFLYFSARGQGENGEVQNAIYKKAVRGSEQPQKLGVELQEGEYLLRFLLTQKEEPLCFVRKKSEGEEAYLLRRYNVQGKLLWEEDFTGHVTGKDDFVFIRDAALNNAGTLYAVSDKHLLMFDAGGNFLRAEKLPEGEVQYMEIGGQEQVFVSCATDSGQTVFMWNETQKTWKECFAVKDGGVLSAFGEEALLLSAENRLLLYNLQSEEMETVLLWDKCNIVSSEIKKLCPVEADTFMVLVGEEAVADEACVAILTKGSVVQQEEPVEKKKLFLAQATSSSGPINAVTAFNRRSGQYDLSVKNYYDENMEFEERLNQLNAAMLSSEPPDLVEVYDRGGMGQYDDYVQNGYLEDLLPYFEAGGKIKPEDLLENIVEEYRRGESIYGIPASFSMETLLCPAFVVGDEPGWTIEEFLDFMELYPHSLPYSGESVAEARSTVCYYMLKKSMNAFIDMEEGTCDFTGERFADALRRINNISIVKISQEPVKKRIEEGEVILENREVYSPVYIRDLEAERGQKYTLIGFPTADGSQGIDLLPQNIWGICATSKEKDGAWDFLEGYLAGYSGKLSFPTGKAAFEEYLMEETEKVYRTDEDGNFILDENGEKIESISTIDGIPMPAVSMEQVEKVREATKAATRNEAACEEIKAIIFEEVSGYFEGKKELEEVLEVIQNRAQLYMQENRR